MPTLKHADIALAQHPRLLNYYTTEAPIVLPAGTTLVVCWGDEGPVARVTLPLTIASENAEKAQKGGV